MIYFIQCGDNGPIKIGYTSDDLQGRIRTLQTNCPYKLELIGRMKGTMEDEKLIHARFLDSRLEGEWFRPSPMILDFIEKHNETGLVQERVRHISRRVAEFKERFALGSYYDLRAELKQLEKDIIQETIKVCGTKAKAAMMLNMGKSSITQKTQKYARHKLIPQDIA